jgi:transcription termination factor Rho
MHERGNVSVESQSLERSALERKDREQLMSIATALGGKPGSRTRKAEIVDLILQLAHVEPAGSAGGSDEAADQPAAAKPARASAANGRSRRGPSRATITVAGADKTGDEKAGDEKASADSDSADSADTNAGSARGTESSTASADASSAGTTSDSDTGAAGTGDDAADIGEARPLRGEGARRGGESGSRNRGQSGREGGRDGGRDGNRDGGRDGNRDGGQRQQGNRGGEQRGGDQRGDDGEPGNRRRRRRGRDRDGGPRPERTERPEEFVGEPVEVAGLLDLRDDGYGFLRLKQYLPSKEDVYVSVKQVRQLGLRRGDHITGASRPASRNEKNPALLRIDTVNGGDPEAARNRPRFEDLTPLFPDEKLRMEVTEDPLNMTARIIDIISPVGKGQRGLIVSPPKAGKTTIMKQIARSIETNNPECHVIVLLVDERPEEVTDFKRWLMRGEVVASTFDRPSDEHTLVAELVIERSKRLVEEGKDVVIILDGITRLARAYNLAAPASGRIMSGGIDAGALYPPKRFFGAARNLEEGGSLTILATALVETNSKMDEHIFEEFKGTGNMELKLDRRLADRRIFPAIDVDASSTRHEELLFDRKQLQMVWKLRRVLSGLSADSSSGAGLEMLIDRLASFKTNDDFLAEIAKAPTGTA